MQMYFVFFFSIYQIYHSQSSTLNGLGSTSVFSNHLKAQLQHLKYLVLGSIDLLWGRLETKKIVLVG